MVHARAVDDGGLRNRSSGVFRTLMRSPEGQEFSNVGCYLEIVKNERLVWTVALAPGYRPASERLDIPSFTAVIALEPQGSGTKYTALAMHRDEEGRKRHEEMGFHEGWGKALDQLVACAKSM